jgi:hypothetical protein
MTDFVKNKGFLEKSAPDGRTDAPQYTAKSVGIIVAKKKIATGF